MEQCRAAVSPIVAAFGSFAAFEAHCDRQIADGLLDPRDFAVVFVCLRNWEDDGTWVA